MILVGFKGDRVAWGSAYDFCSFGPGRGVRGFLGKERLCFKVKCWGCHLPKSRDSFRSRRAWDRLWWVPGSPCDVS